LRPNIKEEIIMNYNTSELSQFVNASIRGLVDGVKDTNCVIGGFVEFELSVVKEVEAGGKINLRIVEAGGKVNEKRVSKIKFYVGSKGLKSFHRLYGELTD
jgi:hypothetical protein